MFNVYDRDIIPHLLDLEDIKRFILALADCKNVFLSTKNGLI